MEASFRLESLTQLLLSPAYFKNWWYGSVSKQVVLHLQQRCVPLATVQTCR